MGSDRLPVSKITLALSVFAVCILTSCKHEVPAPNIKNHLADFGLKGKVKLCIETEYNAVEKSGEIQKGDLEFKVINMFSENGYIVESHIYNSRGNLYSKMAFKYDSNGKLIEMDDYTNGILKSKLTYSYDASGNETERRSYLPGDSLEYRIINKYDANGKKIEEIQFKADGTLDSRYLSIYDSNGKLVETNGFEQDSNQTVRIMHKYDDKGREAESKIYDTDTSNAMTDNFIYDEDGKIIEAINNLGGIVKKTTYSYDRYDNTGNWMFKKETETSFDSKVQVKITERVIEYYKE